MSTISPQVQKSLDTIYSDGRFRGRKFEKMRKEPETYLVSLLKRLEEELSKQHSIVFSIVQESAFEDNLIKARALLEKETEQNS